MATTSLLIPAALRIAASAVWFALLAACAQPVVRGVPVATPGGTVPNTAALAPRLPVPGLAEGWVPQGLARGEAGELYVSSYLPASGKAPPLAGEGGRTALRPAIPNAVPAHGGRCRVYRIAQADGAVTGQFDLAEGACHHAGGLVWLGGAHGGQLLLTDTHDIFRIDVRRALAAGQAAGATRHLRLGGQLLGSWGAFDGRAMWLGSWSRVAEQSHMHRLDPALFDALADGATITLADVSASLPVPLLAQGGAFDAHGGLWLSASNSRWGRLYRADAQGQVLAEYPMPPGLEGLAVDAGGRLWGLSESGALRYAGWPQHFPFVFAIDTDRLE